MLLGLDLSFLDRPTKDTPVLDGRCVLLVEDEAIVADAAILDLNVADGEITPVLEMLLARGLPVVAYTEGNLPEAMHKAARLTS
jgi:hypothetical protein